MRRQAALCVVLVAFVGCSTLGIDKPVKIPKVSTARNAWAATKVLYGANLELFTQYAEAACPGSKCGPDVTVAERRLIEQAKNVHVNAMQVIDQGDAIVDGDYSVVITKLVKLATRLARREISP